MKTLFRVISKSETIQITKQDGTTISKSTIVLQEIGGKYENSYVATLLGELAEAELAPNTFVWASLRFTAREYNGNNYQDVIVSDMIKLS